MGISSKGKDTRYDIARERARALLVLTRQRPPVDVAAIIERAGVPVVERALDPDVRATIGDVAGRRAIIVNRNYQIRSAGERRWVLAEDSGTSRLSTVSSTTRLPELGLLSEGDPVGDADPARADEGPTLARAKWSR